ncbi:phage/plasmid primase, P4 family [Bradyrhizobium sp. 482_C4_N1_1]|uniref:phage/plasmid primase, P4 family n=1 Tax=unclassified Bradyrhizobium TaxID=2631580 RepID=UPI003F8ABF3E
MTQENELRVPPWHDDVPPHEEIARWIESDDTDLSSFATYAPHSAEGEAPHEPRPGSDEYDVDLTEGNRPADADQVSRDVLIACSQEPQNDTGNGKRLLNHFGSDLLHVHNMGWHAWTGTHWEFERGLEVATRHAQTTAARIVLEADVMAATANEQRAIDAASQARDQLAALEKAKGAEARKDRRFQMLMRIVEVGDDAAANLNGRQVARRKYSVSSGNASKLRGMLDQGAVHRTVSIDDLDADKLAFNVMNGTLGFVCDEEPDPDASDHSGKTLKRWRAELRPHNPGDFITKVAPVEYDPKAVCPHFDVSIERFQPIVAVRRFLQRYHGYALTGLTGEQCLVFNYGNGANWKSTFVELVARVMGPYAQTIPFESISGDVQKSGSQASPEFARLPGARMVRASEPDHNVQFKEGLIKSLTGGEPMLTRANFKDFFEFRPDFKLVFSGNHKPKISGVDHGIWRRINLVPWPTKIQRHERRPMAEVMGELWPERSGLLNWLVAGAIDYLNNGLNPPDEVINATAAYQEEMDPVGAFIGMCVEIVLPGADGVRAFVSARAMYDAFADWCFANGITAWKERSFATAMTEKGFDKERHSEGRRYMDVRLHDLPSARPRGRRVDDVPPHPDDDDIVPV